MSLIISFRSLTILVVFFKGEMWRGMCVKRCLCVFKKARFHRSFSVLFLVYRNDELCGQLLEFKKYGCCFFVVNRLGFYYYFLFVKSTLQNGGGNFFIYSYICKIICKY